MVKSKIKQMETEARKHATHTEKKQKQNQINQIAGEQPDKQKNPRMKSTL